MKAVGWHRKSWRRKRQFHLSRVWCLTAWKGTHKPCLRIFWAISWHSQFFSPKKSASNILRKKYNFTVAVQNDTLGISRLHGNMISLHVILGILSSGDSSRSPMQYINTLKSNLDFKVSQPMQNPLPKTRRNTKGQRASGQWRKIKILQPQTSSPKFCLIHFAICTQTDLFVYVKWSRGKHLSLDRHLWIWRILRNPEWAIETSLVISSFPFERCQIVLIVNKRVLLLKIYECPGSWNWHPCVMRLRLA